MILRDYQRQGIDDILSAFRSGLRRVCYVAPCGAGKTLLMAYMADSAAKRGNETIFLVHRQELLDQAETTLQEYGITRGVTVHNVQTLTRRIHTVNPQLIVIDEAHHATARTWRNIIDAYPDAYVVGLTATPARLGGQGLADVFDGLVIGPTARELIQQGYLSPYKYYAPPQVADTAEIKIKLGDYDQAEIALRMDKPAVIGDAIQHYLKLAVDKRAICYCSSRSHSRNTTAAFQSIGIAAVHIDGETPAEMRRKAITDFRNGCLTVICNVDLIGEGLDVPGCEAVILLRPTASLTLFIQQSMRCMRPVEGKQAIILDHVGNAYRHGLPDEDREWSLDGIKKRRRNEEKSFIIRQCPKCFAVSRVVPICEYCGWVYPVEVRQPEQKEGELKELTAVERKQKRMEVGMARTVEDLEKIAAERGYAPGWVWYQKRLKGLK